MYVDWLAYFNVVCMYMKADLLKSFGLRIRSLRKDKGWTQEDLAEKTGFHRTYIGMIERGERNPSLINVRVFASAFSLKLNELFENVQL